MHVQGTYAIELGNLGYWEHSPFYYDARIDIDSRADGVFVSLSNSGNYSFRLDFRGAAHSLDNATYFGDVLDQVFLGTGFTLTQATFRGEYFTETEFGSEQFFWGGDLSIDDFQNVSPVPEPSTAAMAAAGLFVLGAVARRRKAGDAKRIAA
ncbi:PEP-CTERM sorting domain-containing protein [Pseudoduganella umbonata]|nr:PEP-CTERM sorting domain-containing protein [Pseudoduganella umbonata]